MVTSGKHEKSDLQLYGLYILVIILIFLFNNCVQV